MWCTEVTHFADLHWLSLHMKAFLDMWLISILSGWSLSALAVCHASSCSRVTIAQHRSDMTGGDWGLQPADGVYGCCEGGQESVGFPLRACSSDWPPQSADSDQASLVPLPRHTCSGLNIANATDPTCTMIMV